eukprot:TCALIF_02413-PA protein Name:"Similar to twk-18 TWiK family of potassium channels protein 18 (Caenorhabditis elegans)" AED:0.23 eAED:0.23 QI:0/0.33/0/0.5/1/1/4/0/893
MKGPLRNEVIRQELRIERLTNQVQELTRLYKKCDRNRKKTKRFLMSVIEKYRGDNVHLSLDKCYQYCHDHKFSAQVCDEVCSYEMKDSPCTLWQFDSMRSKNYNTAPSIDYSTPPYIRVERTTTETAQETSTLFPHFFPETSTVHKPLDPSESVTNHESPMHPTTDTSTSIESPENNNLTSPVWNPTESTEPSVTMDKVSLYEYLFQFFFTFIKDEDSFHTTKSRPEPKPSTPKYSALIEFKRPKRAALSTDRMRRSPKSESDDKSVINSRRVDNFSTVKNADVSGQLILSKRLLNPPPCSTLTCVINNERTATVCLSITENFDNDQMHAMLRPVNDHEGQEHFNVLYRENWTHAAREVINKFEQIVIRKAKTEGYDGGDSEDSVQWNFSGALLYSVTVITTIGYGNIAPKTSWGRSVTMIYAIFGMPLFLMWASQMGTLLAHSFQLVYSTICCGICRRGKRKRAMSRMRKNEQLLLQQKQKQQETVSLPGTVDKEKRIDGSISTSASNTLPPSRVPLPNTTTPKVHHFQVNESEPALSLSSTSNLLPNKAHMAADTPVHAPLALATPFVFNQHHLEKKTAQKEIMDPHVKELLSTCAKYNLDQGPNGKDDGCSAEVLEEIRHVEAIETIRNQSAVSVIVNPNSPRSPTSPGPLPRPPPQLSDDTTTVINGSTPLAMRRARLGHPTVVSVSVEGNNTPVTSLLGSPSILKSPPPYSPNPLSKLQTSRDPSPVTSLRLGADGGSLNGIGSSDKDDNASSVIKVSVQPRMHDNSSSLQDRVPVLPVLIFVGGYIFIGAGIFSTWENWSMLEGAYFCFITLTTIGFGDFVPGDAVLNDTSENGQAKLLIACIYVLMGLAVVAMSINLVQEEIMGKFRQLAKDMGIIDDDDDDLVSA